MKQGPVEPLIPEPQTPVAQFLEDLSANRLPYDISEIEDQEFMQELSAEFEWMIDECISNELIKIWLTQFRDGFILTAKLIADGDAELVENS